MLTYLCSTWFWFRGVYIHWLIGCFQSGHLRGRRWRLRHWGRGYIGCQINGSLLLLEHRRCWLLLLLLWWHRGRGLLLLEHRRGLLLLEHRRGLLLLEHRKGLLLLLLLLLEIRGRGMLLCSIPKESTKDSSMLGSVWYLGLLVTTVNTNSSST